MEFTIIVVGLGSKTTWKCSFNTVFYFLLVLSVHHRLGVGIPFHAVTQGPELMEALSPVPILAGTTQSLDCSGRRVA